MKNQIVSVPLTESDKSLLDNLQASDGFKLLMNCLKAELDDHLLMGAYIRVDTNTPNGKEEAEHHFQQAELLKNVIAEIETTLKTPKSKETKYAS
jgi:hypothetical protein